jgi:hypothetical protein
MNSGLVALPLGTILLHVYGPAIKAHSTFGMQAIILGKIVTLFQQTIYTVLACLITGTLALLRTVHRRRLCDALLWLAVAMLILSVLLDNKMGTVGADSLAEILCTNWHEASAYGLQALSTMNISGKQLVASLSPLAFYGLLALLSTVSGLRLKRNLAILALAVSGVTVGVLLARDLSRLVSAYHDIHLVQQRLLQATRPNFGQFTRKHFGPRLVVYIGESTNREFYRALRERVESRPFKNNIVYFDQVISPHSHTTPSLLRELTVSEDPFRDQLKYDTELWRANLISVLNHTGVGVAWYSNQGQDEWPALLFGKEANRWYFEKQPWGSAFSGPHKPDSGMLAQFRSAIRTPGSSAVFFHSYAGHFPYCDHLPSDTPSALPDIRTSVHFKAAFGDLPTLNEQGHVREINCYDRALAYIALNLDSVMQEMWAAAQPMVLLYFSDHGEDVLDATGHESGIASYRKIEVPLIAFFNAAARRDYESEFNAARNNKSSRYSLAWISDSLADIAGLSYKRDLLSIFRPIDRTPDRYSSLRLYHGKRFIIAVDDDRDARGIATLSDIDLYEKRRLIHSLAPESQNHICAHRADSLMKFNEASEVFSCLEVDLVVAPAAQQVYVFHPPKENNYLTLRDLLLYHSGRWSKLWLDTKNLNTSNGAFYLQYLNELFAFPERREILIETSVDNSEDAQVRDMLANFRQSGYHLSFYLPTPQGVRCSQFAMASGCAEFAEHVVETISNLPYDSLSFDIRAKFVAKAIQRRQPIQLNTWDADLKEASEIDPEILGQASMYLIPYRSRFDY